MKYLENIVIFQINIDTYLRKISPHDSDKKNSFKGFTSSVMNPSWISDNYIKVIQ